jgi:hypothetical protein
MGLCDLGPSSSGAFGKSQVSWPSERISAFDSYKATLSLHLARLLLPCKKLGWIYGDQSYLVILNNGFAAGFEKMSPAGIAAFSKA